MSGDQEVNQATLALKSMLNIGGSAAEAAVEEPKIQSKTSSSKKKRNKKTKLQQQPAKQKQGGPPQAKDSVPPKKDPKANKKKKQPKPEGQKETFAWSAFQSSPDASALPIPTFATPQSEKPTVADGLLSNSISLPLHPDKNAVSLNAHATVNAAGDTGHGGTVELSMRSSHQEGANAASEESGIEPVSGGPASNSGVNLAAALTAKPTPNERQSAVSAVSPGISGHEPPIYSTGTGAPMYPPPPHQYHQHHPHPPMGYITLQVQVPHNLMPGRQMVVTSPNGYPVSVVVPEGIAPGAVIPVHVAAPPMMMTQPPPPYHFRRGPLQPPPKPR